MARYSACVVNDPNGAACRDNARSGGLFAVFPLNFQQFHSILITNSFPQPAVSGRSLLRLISWDEAVTKRRQPVPPPPGRHCLGLQRPSRRSPAAELLYMT